MYLLSSMLTSLDTSLPEESGFVQYTPLVLLPLIESGSFGIWFKEIDAKCGIPRLVSKPFIFNILLHASLSLAMSNLISCLWKSFNDSDLKK